MRLKILLLLVGILLNIVAYHVGHWRGYKAGYAQKIAEDNAAIVQHYEAQLQKERKNVKIRTETRIIYRDRQTSIQNAIDPSGCADTDVPADLLCRVKSGISCMSGTREVEQTGTGR